MPNACRWVRRWYGRLCEERREDLTTATTDELIEELKRRSRALAIAFDSLAQGKETFYKTCRHGDKLVVSGLITALRLDSEYDFLNDPRNKPTDET